MLVLIRASSSLPCIPRWGFSFSHLSDQGCALSNLFLYISQPFNVPLFITMMMIAVLILQTHITFFYVDSLAYVCTKQSLRSHWQIITWAPVRTRDLQWSWWYVHSYLHYVRLYRDFWEDVKSCQQHKFFPLIVDILHHSSADCKRLEADQRVYRCWT